MHPKLMTPEVTALAKKILDAFERDRQIAKANGTTTKTLGCLGLIAWMARHLTQGDLSLMEEVEDVIGEDEANQWLTGIILLSAESTQPTQAQAQA